MADYNFMDFENQSEPLASHLTFVRRLVRNIFYSLVLVLTSLAVGMWGYAELEGMTMADAFVNAAMILSGMGPVGTLHSDAAKIFAGLYALYSGFFIITITAFLLAPVVHRVLHRFHAEVEADEENKDATTRVS